MCVIISYFYSSVKHIVFISSLFPLVLLETSIFASASSWVFLHSLLVPVLTPSTGERVNDVDEQTTWTISSTLRHHGG
uniref:Putative secreted protein n=1 Tax=Anopheles darlingi TaxID=43151 RepID=A0A2M4D4A0_ANODA